ncbi:hypothetical protein ACEV6Q_08360 [Enterobacter ludwigii]|uniref:hypothetical protein n=1 Tax=Enterobacter ludwigii TaxID=299767 RepID=UPI003BEF3B3B
MTQQFTNELTPEILAGLDKSPFTPAQLAEMNDDARALIEKQAAFNREHPVTAIYRIAVAGSLTRRGGVVDEFNTNPEEGHKIRLSNDRWVSVAAEGCRVTYPDGSTAHIVSSTGTKLDDRRQIALVGSLLDNGDVIISTPQGNSFKVEREGVPLTHSFLTSSRLEYEA